MVMEITGRDPTPIRLFILLGVILVLIVAMGIFLFIGRSQGLISPLPDDKGNVRIIFASPGTDLEPTPNASEEPESTAEAETPSPSSLVSPSPRAKVSPSPSITPST